MVPEEQLHDKSFVTLEDMELYGRWMDIQGYKFPWTERVPDVALYEIKPARVFKIRQKATKTVFE